MSPEVEGLIYLYTHHWQFVVASTALFIGGLICWRKDRQTLGSFLILFSCVPALVVVALFLAMGLLIAGACSVLD